MQILNLKKILLLAYLVITLPAYGSFVLSPSVQIDSIGYAYEIWLYSENADDSYVVQASIAPIGEKTTPTPLSGSVSANANPVLAINSRGDVVVLWTVYDNLAKLVVFKAVTRPASTGLWSKVSTLMSPGNALNNLKVSINDSGDIIAMWLAYTDSLNTDLAAFISTAQISDGAWSSVIQISP